MSHSYVTVSLYPQRNLESERRERTKDGLLGLYPTTSTLRAAPSGPRAHTLSRQQEEQLSAEAPDRPSESLNPVGLE